MLVTSLGCDDTPAGSTRDSGPVVSRDAATMASDATIASDAAPLDAASSGDDAAVSVDAAAADASPGDATAADSGLPGACGLTRCRGDQVCVADACVLRGCVGAAVPGDYGTIQAAIGALQGPGGTICVGEGTFPEALTFDQANGLTLQGVSAEKTRVRSLEGHATSSGLTIRGIGATEHSALHYGTITVEDSAFASSSFPALQCRAGAGVALNLTIRRTQIVGIGQTALYIGSSSGGTVAALVDGADISGTYGLSFDPAPSNEGQGGGSLTVQNSYIHDCSEVGLSAYLPTGSLHLFSNTITRNANGVQASWTTQQPRLSVVGNIVSSSTVALFINVPTLVDSHNALFGNVTNYGGIARDGPGYVKTDCLLVAGFGPPSLAPSSPCRGAGDATAQPMHDYWGVMRPSPPSIGAVEP